MILILLSDLSDIPKIWTRKGVQIFVVMLEAMMSHEIYTTNAGLGARRCRYHLLVNVYDRDKRVSMFGFVFFQGEGGGGGEAIRYL